jgi:hypothetical protein
VLCVVGTLLLLVTATARADISLPDGNNIDPIVITAQAANRWQMDSYEVWIMRGDVRFAQGDDVANCREAVFWIDHAETASRRRTKVIAYLEGEVNVRLIRDRDPVQIRDKKWFGRFYTIGDVRIQAGVVAGKPTVLPEIYQHGMDQRNPEFADTLRQSHAEQVLYVAPTNELPPPGQPSPAAGPPAPGIAPSAPGELRIHIYSRSDVPPQAEWRKDPARNQSILTVEQGITANIEGLTVNIPGIGRDPVTLDISADRLVAWTTAGNQNDTFNFSVGDNQPLEIYLEGNVVFREGDRIIYADRMYYDVRHRVGTVLSADMITPAPGYSGKLRLHADILEQEGPDRFRGQDVYVTPSRLGVPRIRLQAGEASFEDVQTPKVDPLTGMPLFDAQQRPLVDHEQIVSAQNNFVYIEDVPVFYWPTFTTDLNDPSFFVRSIRFKQDNVFGTQFYSDFAAYQLLGIKQKPAGTDWTVGINYLSLRGLSETTTFTYDRQDFFGIPGPVTGQWTFWGIDDHGTDNLGQGRTNVLPEPDVNYRYDLIGRHRQEIADGLTVWGEFGKISDRNFLLEYFKPVWDEQKDPTTDLGLTYRTGDMSMSLFAQERLNNFVTETNWLPRFDHFLLGQSLLADKLTWFEHTSVGYAQFRVGTLPNPAAGDEQVSLLPWEPQNFSGGRFITRNEIDLPLELGPVKVVPYALGEIGYWSQDINAQALTRAYYQAGVRATLPMWAVDCEAESALWNVHGLAHKVEFQAEYLHSQTNQSVTEFPLYDPLDDHQIEDFRRRYVVNTFGFPPVLPPATQGPPPQFDERFYAVRTDMQGWVTAPSMEIAENLDELRLGIHERWQTKRGPADCPHIIDWVEFDTDFTIFPDPNRDNFGNSIGLWDYNFVWHVGDRLTLLSDGIFDFFDQGQKIVTMGMFLTRPPRGALYLGYQLLEGPIDSQILSMSYSYWMSPKWITTTGVTMDMHNIQNVAPAFQLIRVGESLLIALNISYDPARQTAGVGLSVEPRFLPNTGRLGSATSVRIPPAGEMGVE